MGFLPIVLLWYFVLLIGTQRLPYKKLWGKRCILDVSIPKLWKALIMEIYGKVEEFLSFKRIPYSVYRNLADALEKRGLNEEEILDWLSSTRIRHCIDGARRFIE